MVLGCQPGLGVIGDTKLIKDVMNNFTSYYDKLTLTVVFPDILDRLQGSDTNIEMITSSTISKLRISEESNKVARSSAYIFANSCIECPGLETLTYLDCDSRVKKTEEFFKDMLKFHHVETHKDLAKA